jgi:hypothetical protein
MSQVQGTGKLGLSLSLRVGNHRENKKGSKNLKNKNEIINTYLQILKIVSGKFCPLKIEEL